ncbi:MAG: cytochrome b/b6 domain-containing protein [Pseudomonadota bacterium]
MKLWDLPTRAFHILIALLVVTSWFTAENGFMELHLISGLSVISLVVFRVIWGLVGSSTSRFAGFIRSPAAAIDYAKALFRKTPPHYAGHNPLGGWAIMLMLFLLIGQASLGLFSRDDVLFEGPLSYLVSNDLSLEITEFHELLFNLLTGVIVVHVGAALYYRFILKEPLIDAMVTGKNHKLDPAAHPHPSFRSPIIALVIAGASFGTVFWLWGGQLF